MWLTFPVAEAAVEPPSSPPRCTFNHNDRSGLRFSHSCYSFLLFTSNPRVKSKDITHRVPTIVEMFYLGLACRSIGCLYVWCLFTVKGCRGNFLRMLLLDACSCSSVCDFSRVSRAAVLGNLREFQFCLQWARLFAWGKHEKYRAFKTVCVLFQDPSKDSKNRPLQIGAIIFSHFICLCLQYQCQLMHVRMLTLICSSAGMLYFYMALLGLKNWNFDINKVWS